MNGNRTDPIAGGRTGGCRHGPHRDADGRHAVVEDAPGLVRQVVGEDGAVLESRGPPRTRTQTMRRLAARSTCDGAATEPGSAAQGRPLPCISERIWSVPCPRRTRSPSGRRTAGSHRARWSRPTRHPPTPRRSSSLTFGARLLAVERMPHGNRPPVRGVRLHDAVSVAEGPAEPPAFADGRQVTPGDAGHVVEEAPVREGRVVGVDAVLAEQLPVGLDAVAVGARDLDPGPAFPGLLLRPAPRSGGRRRPAGRWPAGASSGS